MPKESQATNRRGIIGTSTEIDFVATSYSDTTLWRIPRHLPLSYISVVQIFLGDIGAQFLLLTGRQRPQAQRIGKIDRTICHVDKEIRVATRELKWIFTDKPTDCWIVVPGTV